AAKSYRQAADECKARVAAIVKECERLNQKYQDRSFDLDNDMDCMKERSPNLHCDETEDIDFPPWVKRVEDIFDDPHFFIDGASAEDVHQGNDGDCWFLAALMAVTAKKDLISKLCVARDEKVGVYGFVFFRDGEWISEVIDDKLYLRVLLQKGGEALYFSHCKSNETWLPLIEKAYAKAHGDYRAIEGGWVSEGIEDLTGGVAVGLNPEDIMDKDRFWKEQLMEVNKKYLFGCSSHLAFRKGIYETHAYVVLQAWEEGDLKLVKIRNPWGEREWMGDWSDGDKLWTAEMMTKLNHTFGDDGVFWMTYKDFLKHFRAISRTRLFDESWKVATRWTSVNVPWTPDFLDTKFQFTLSKPGPVVIVLSQPDDRYFRGLTGRFIHQLHFRLHEQSASSDDETDPEAGWIVRSMHASGNNPRNTRSVSAEVEDLPAGTYTVLIKITTRRWDDDNTFAETIAETAQKRKEKLLGVGRRFDYAQSKGDRRGAERRARQIKASDAFAKHLLALRRQRKITRDSRARKRRRDERRKAVEEAWT
ncbi:cysteine proteinase, partial [Dissoconium aciculare CBS 342.82]|uniref:Cysteine proteinase n=1 Tax=Dissoconium aciculare CBS 342.82 TaxID=1314786 RepID=A0A6J3LPP4_9PEZI